MSNPVEARPLASTEREPVLSHLTRDARSNLILLDMTDKLGAPPSPGEMASQVIGAWRGDALVAVAGLRPSIVFDAHAGPEAVDATVPLLEGVGVGLVKSVPDVVERLWAHLSRDRRRRVIIDRMETGYALSAADARLRSPGPGETIRAAGRRDLEDLVHAARESLREENRPDPFAGDVRGFRHWVKGRVSRARVVVRADRVVFVGYADVRRSEGWLIQGVYTWPEMRRRGHARVGISELCREAFEAGADHVQLAVVDGNEPGRRLYEELGFEPFTRQRTILFSYA